MTPENVLTKIQAEIHWSVAKEKQKKHIDHVKFALDLVEDIENYDDDLFIFYSRKVERMLYE